MGRKPAEILRVSPNAMGGRKNWPCFMEMMAFMSCLKNKNFNDDPCFAEKAALNSCMELQAKKGKTRSALNYHLQRIARTLKR